MADSTVNDLTAASTLDGTELLYGVQGGADRKVTVAQVRAGLLPLTGGAMSGNIVLAGAPSQALHPASKTYVDDGLAAKAASSHAHATSDVTGLDAALAGKAATGHTHVAANVTDFSEAVDDRVNALLVEGTGITLTYDDNAGTLTVDAAGGGSIDGSGTADYAARWTDTDTLAAGALRDDGTSVGLGGAPAADVLLQLEPTAGRPIQIRFKGIGGIANPRVLWEDATGGVAEQTFADGAWGWAQSGNAATVLLDPGYPDSVWKTHPTAAAQMSWATHDGSDYVTVLRVTNGKAQLWDGSALVDVSIGAADSAGAGFRLVRVPN